MIFLKSEILTYYYKKQNTVQALLAMTESEKTLYKKRFRSSLLKDCLHTNGITPPQIKIVDCFFGDSLKFLVILFRFALCLACMPRKYCIFARNDRNNPAKQKNRFVLHFACG